MKKSTKNKSDIDKLNDLIEESKKISGIEVKEESKNRLKELDMGSIQENLENGSLSMKMLIDILRSKPNIILKYNKL